MPSSGPARVAVSSGAFAALEGSGVDDDADISGAVHDGPRPEPAVFYGVAPPQRRFHERFLYCSEKRHSEATFGMPF